MPIVIGLAGVALALIALLILYGVEAFGKAVAQLFPKHIGIGPFGISPRSWVDAAVSSASLAIGWIMGELIRPIIGFVLRPVIAVLGWAQAVERFVVTASSEVQWIVTHGIPQALSVAKALARELYGLARQYAHSLYVASEHYAQRIVGALRAALLDAIAVVRKYAHSLYVASEHYAQRIVRALHATLVAEVTAARHYALSLTTAARHDLTKAIRAVEAEISTVGAVTAGMVTTAVADGVKAAEDFSSAAVAAGINAVDLDVEQAIAGLFDGLITDVGALGDVIATDLPDIGAAVKAIPRAIPTDLAGDIALSLSLAVPMLRYMRECGIPNCRNLSGFGRALKELEALIGGASFLTLLVELISDPEGAAREVQSFLGPIVDDTAGLARNLLGV